MVLKHLADMLGRRFQEQEDSLFASLDAANHWLSSIARLPDMEAHRNVTTLLEQHLQTPVPPSDMRVQVFGLIEQQGSKLQYELIRQYLGQPLDKTGQARYWTRIVNFYQLMAKNYQTLVELDLAQEELPASLPTNVLRALHYHGKLIQWHYIQFILPLPHVWQNLHNLYRIALNQNFAQRSMVLKGSAYATCEAVYARILLLHLMHPFDFQAFQVELAAYWSWKWRDGIRFESRHKAGTRSHFVDLGSGNPPQTLGKSATKGEVICFDISTVLQGLRSYQIKLESEPGNVINLYGLPCLTDRVGVLQRINTHLSAKCHLHHGASHLPVYVQIRCSQSNIIDSLVNPHQCIRVQGRCHTAGHPDEPWFIINIVETHNELKLHLNQLLVVDSGPSTPSILAAVRWIDEKGSQLLTLGMERLGQAPRVVSYRPVSDPTVAPPSLTDQNNNDAIAVAISHPTALVGFHAVQHRWLDVTEPDAIYRVKPLAAQDSNPQWLLFPVIRLSRTRLRQTAGQSPANAGAHH